jgi:GT2 family glycosyltransferase
MATRLKASICIPSYNRKQLLLATLRSLNRQTAAPGSYEVIVTNDGSTDGTVDAMETLKPRYRLRWSTQENAGAAAAMNRAAQLAENEVLIFLGADQVCTASLVRTHLQVHEEEGDVLVQGLYPTADGYRSRGTSLGYERSLLTSLSPTHRRHAMSPYIWGANISVRRTTWEQVGGFDVSFRSYGGEDTDFGLRVANLGIPFIFEPRALSYHLHDLRYPSFRRQAFDEGRSLVQLSQKHGIPVEALFGGPLNNPIDRLVEKGWTLSPPTMDAAGRVLSLSVAATDLSRLRGAQLTAARLVHRVYKLGGLVAEGYGRGARTHAVGRPA